ncbi:acyl transferase domain-containing protein [Aspergillus varians]
MVSSAFLEAADAGRLRIYACCGGQGPNNLTGLDDLVHLRHTYAACPPIQQLIDFSSRRLDALATIPHRSQFFSGRGFPLRAWLDDRAESAPSSDELALSPYSFPINTLLSLIHYAVAAYSLGLDPTELRSRLHGVIGHSQGIFAVAALSHTGAGWGAFYHAADLALQVSFWVGLESHLAAPGSILSAEDVEDCLEHGEGVPSHLLSITGIKAAQLARLVPALNKTDGDSGSTVHLSLINGHSKSVLAGAPQGLRSVCQALRRVKAPQTLDQSRVTFNRRRPVIDAQFLPISAPYHSPLLGSVKADVMKSAQGLRLTGNDLAVPIFCPINGEIVNLQDHGADDILPVLIRAVTVERIDWPALCRRMDGATHVLSFGPGAVGNLVQDALEGTGVHTVTLSGRSMPSSLSSLRTPSPAVPVGLHWASKYPPRLRRAAVKEVKTYIETKMTRLLGTPHIMVAGMTPTTCAPDFVAVIMQAGYHAEFACGGYHHRAAMGAALRRLAGAIPVHRAITCNVIYASPKSLSWQIELLHDLIAEGLPIEGLTVGAGIPSPDVIMEWIEALKLSHIWFKPGSVNAIDRVLAIARQHPTLPVGLQWTGGRAGGHHSCEDFHQPILECYNRIRECDNIILVAGSGFGSGQDTWPYLTGSWSQELGFPAMPFDGILLGSRMMVACEARTSLAAKQLIVEASGIEDSNENHGSWTPSEHQAVGGVISVISEMGQPIHVLATRGMRLWHEFDRRFFCIRDPGRLQATLQQHRVEIITRLNADYARPWFAIADDGQPVEIEDLSYRQVLCRLCLLTFVGHQSRWIDPSYLRLVHDFIRLVHARFGSWFQLSEDPEELQTALDATYGTQIDQTLYPDDVALLLARFRQQGQKPVPFIPRLDANFETWFKKDSLWQSEDIDAVLGQDAQRVCIIQGPVAAQHSNACDEPAAHILDSIRDAHIEMLLQQSSADDGDTTLSREVAHLSVKGYLRRYHLVGPTVPSPQAIIENLVGDCDWARAALVSKSLVFGQARVKNPVRDAFQPEIGDVVEIRYANDSPREITLYTAAPQRQDDIEIEVCAALELVQVKAGEVSVTLLSQSVRGVGAKASSDRPTVGFTMRILGGSMGCPVLQVNRKDYLDRIRRLYTGLWIGGHGALPASSGLSSEFTDGPMTITAENVQAFAAVVGQTGPARCRAWSAQGPVVPLDYAVVIAWTVLTKPVLLPALDGDPLQLLHQSISFHFVRGVRPLHVGDMVRTSSRITERAVTATGQRIEVSADILRDAQPVVHLRTTFAIQRRPEGTSPQQFRSIDEPTMVMHVKSVVELHLLASRKWLFLDGPSHDLLGKTLVFRLSSQTAYDASGASSSLQVSGPVTLFREQSVSGVLGGAKIGRVYLEIDGHKSNPVMDFLGRHGEPLVQRKMLQSPGWIGEAAIPFTAPSQSSVYAMVSKDTNPLHVCPLFARFAGRDQPVLHGMHLSATVRRILEWQIGDTHRARFQSWTASFDGIVRTGDRLRMEVQHRAMEEGLMVVYAKVLNENTGAQVMHAEASLDQAQTAYVFTGQGTQEQGMGMALYAAHKAAQTVWDRAEQHFESQYGISLLHIIRNNPTTVTVNFCSKRGRQIRANYLAMASGSDSDTCMLPGLTEKSRVYTFSYPAGLLMSTQFAQPALVVMEMAEYAHLQAQGVIQTPALFAGHSLGEYGALGACSTLLPFEPLLSLIFYRGLKMQNALPRDENGRTDYAMMAVDPSRIGPEFTEHGLLQLVQLIGAGTGQLLEVVNHNIESKQYVCAGHVQSLWVLGHACDELSRSTTPNSPDIVKECINRHFPNRKSVTNQTTLLRGRATIPLPGVDIPFHSQMLRGHIDDYRQYLRRHLRLSDIKAEDFVGRWVPNVVGKPFSLDSEYIRLVQEVTTSQPLQDLLQRIGDGS